MQPEDDNPKTPLRPWVLPMMLASIGVVVLGIVLTYADTTGGAFVVLLGLIGVGWAAAGAAKSS